MQVFPSALASFSKTILPGCLFLFFCAAAGAELRGQCTGNLGANIFTNGDFGAGTEVVFSTNPNLAPGFIYDRNPPPADGYYTITNNTGAWMRTTFGNWDLFRDNSNDPNGYMMVVNAAYEPGEFYEQEVSGLCGDTEYQVSLDIRNIVRSGTNLILPNVSFSVDDVQQGTTGDVPENQRWNTYVFSFVTRPDQTTAVLTMRNNAPGGIGNDLAIDNIEFRACGPQADIAGPEMIQVCEDGQSFDLELTVIGDQYGENPGIQWQQSADGIGEWTDIPGATGPTLVHTSLRSGNYFYRYLLASSPLNIGNAKCRVLSNVKAVYVVPKEYEVVDTICQGLSYQVGDQEYRTSGSTIDTLRSVRGCDSIVSLQLTVVPDTDVTPILVGTDPACSYTSDGTVELISVQGGAAPFELSFDQIIQTDTLIDNLLGGAYQIRVQDRFGCAADREIILTTPPEFFVDLGPDQLIRLGQTARVNVVSNYELMNATFSPEGLFNCPPGCEQLSFLPLQTQHLRLFAQNEANCVASDSVVIAVDAVRDIYFPTAFSPNGDGFNDIFSPYGEPERVVGLSMLRIYDRWGALLFELENIPINDARIGWNGQAFSGKQCGSGAYVYTCEVIYVDNETREFAGLVQLIR